MLLLFLLGEIPQPCMAAEKQCFEAAPLFFPETLQIDFVCQKLLLESFFAVISSQNLKIYMKIASHAWLEIAPWENLFAF